jgi:hypothetical protein
MNMGSEDIKNPAQQPPQYADEVLCANWNPLVLLLAESLVRAPKPMPDGSDVEGFMARLYLCQQA